MRNVRVVEAQRCHAPQPVAPVLNETREIVKIFNRILKDVVTAIPW